MELSYEDVLEILAVLENSNVEYLEVEIGDTKLVANKSGMTLAESLGPKLSVGPTTPTKQLPLDAPSADKTSLIDVGILQDEDEVDVSLVPVLAPIVGVFYRQSEPGARPYVEIGAQVEEGSTLGLMEVMKMFTSVTSPVKGEVVRIMVENEEFVEFEQPLILIRPETQV